MINGINHQKPSPKFARLNQSEQDVKNAKAPAQVSKPSAPSAAVRPAAALGASLQAAPVSDKLSASIVSFARFFSLSLKPQMLADIRRQAVLPRQPSSLLLKQEGETPAFIKTREYTEHNKTAKQAALSLAAAAAESKGAELHPKGLESYAEAVDPDSRRHNNEERRRKREKNEKEREPLKTEAVTADSLKKMSFEYLRENPIIDIMNKLPGKNGRRWAAFPFDFSDGNKDFFVTMRVLIDGSQPLMFALDIGMLLNEKSENREFDQRWLFAMECANEKPVRLSVVNQPELPKKSQPQLIDELSRIFDISAERIIVKSVAPNNGAEPFPFEAQLSEPPQSVYEAF